MASLTCALLFLGWSDIIGEDGHGYLCNLIYREPIGADEVYHWKWEDPDADMREIKRSNTSLCMDVSGGSQATGAAVVQGTCSPTNHSQWWAQEGSYDGYGLLLNYHSGKCAGLNSSNLLVLAACSGNDHAQLWSKTQFGTVWMFTNYHTGQVLSVPGGYTTPGWQLGVYPDLGVDYQRWGIVGITLPLASASAGGTPAEGATPPATSPPGATPAVTPTDAAQSTPTDESTEFPSSAPPSSPASPSATSPSSGSASPAPPSSALPSSEAPAFASPAAVSPSGPGGQYQ